MKQDHETSEGVVAALWNRGATWEHKDTMRAHYPFLLKEEGMF